MASVIKLIGLVLCMISLILEMKGFEALQSIAPLGNNRLSTACSFKDETLAMTTTELVGWYVVMIISLVKPGGGLLSCQHRGGPFDRVSLCNLYPDYFWLRRAVWHIA